MKHYYIAILFFFISNASFGLGKTTPVIEDVKIDLNQPIYNHVQELKKGADGFSLKISYDAPIKNISFSYTRKRASETPLNLPVAPAGAAALRATGTDIEVLTVSRVLPGDVYTIKIKYFDTEERTVDVEVSVPAKNFWTIAYGNNFIFNRSFNPGGHQDYFLKQGTAGAYTISSKKGNALTYAPSVNFMNLEYAESDIGFAYGASLGLETNSATPTVSAGLGLHFSYQIQVLAGIVMHQTPTLRPEYNVGESVTSLLSADQLTRNTYRGDVFISLNFRFDRNPRE